MKHLSLAILVGGAGLAASAQAKDVPFDFDHCYSGTFASLSETDDVYAGRFEVTGVLRSNGDAKTFDNATSHCMGVDKTVKDNTTFLGYCKLMTPSGDWILYEQERTLESETWDWKVVDAGGNWKGATGSGASTRLTKTKAIVEGTFQACNRHEGSLTLPEN